ncbi:MAG: hypothetical protein A2X28_03025 [Elusimicrobia bacterium GWA2_56_46]|nr:MAG: hypothetical protein A2X28_03025 [Elusimicrobia bacterium GWA2_56_46]OGR54201.1 MAG: hypothetical protein A2X39_08970 [Elusimicrobia bacterium GWC2_56_31]HBB68269.1 hypothetical protein [Elusimicrobiota bacterium]HBW21779.1 hypothetical protein [Elusimicrobiota bacterium]
MHNAAFDFHGCGLEFRSEDPELVAWLSSDFSAFASTRAAAPLITVTALRRDPALQEPLPAILKTKKLHILAAPAGRRRVWYPEGALCEYDYRAGAGLVMSRDTDLLRELSYLLILSRVGEALDLRGLHRLHAGALAYRGKALIFCGRQGAGKTTLLLELLRDKDFFLLSDDTPLISGDGGVHPFPARIGLGEDNPHLPRLGRLRGFRRRHYPPKRLLDISGCGITVSGPTPPALIFRLERGGQPRFLRPGPLAGALEGAKSLVAGAGTPQMAEYFLRASPEDLARKVKIAASRVSAARSLFAKTPFWIFRRGPDPASNAAAFKEFLRSGSVTAFSS